MGEDAQDLVSILDSWEQRLTHDGASFGVRTVDRINGLRQTPDHLRHQGVAVAIPETLDDGDRHGDRERVRDTVVLEIQYQASPLDQRKGRRDALGFEDRVRRLVTDPTWEPTLHVQHRSTRRAIHPQSADWVVTTLTFSQTRNRRTK